MKHSLERWCILFDPTPKQIRNQIHGGVHNIHQVLIIFCLLIEDVMSSAYWGYMAVVTEDKKRNNERYFIVATYDIMTKVMDVIGRYYSRLICVGMEVMSVEGINLLPWSLKMSIPRLWTLAPYCRVRSTESKFSPLVITTLFFSLSWYHLSYLFWDCIFVDKYFKLMVCIIV